MRTTLQSELRQSLLNIRSASARRSEANRLISSGLRVQQPSDSPNDAAAIVRLRSGLATLAQFRQNLQTAQAEIRAIDGALFDANDSLTRALTIGAQAATATQTEESRRSMAIEVEAIQRQLVDIGNTVFGGRYVFAGSSDSEPPFVEDPSDSTRIVYNGDSTSREIIFPDGRPARVSLPGDAIFSTPENFVGSGFNDPGVTPPANPPISVGLAFSGEVDAVVSVDLNQLAAADVVDALNAAVQGDERLQAAGLEFSLLDGEIAVDGDVDFTFTAIDFDRGSGFQSGLAGTHTIGGVNSADALGALGDLAASLRNNDLEGIENGISGLRRAAERINSAQGFYGGTLRQIEMTVDNLNRIDTVNQDRLSQRQDADLLEAISQFQAATSAEQFALQVAARRQPNLLDLLA